MDRPVFEIRRMDAAGRLGRLEIPRADVTVETPALLPVVNPNHQQIPPARLADEFGAEILITNAYLISQDETLHSGARNHGLRELLDFSGAIMTDSGSFQLAEYGDVDITTEEILAFQDAIGSDIATPVDIPTPPDADRTRAETDLEVTSEALAVSHAFEAGTMLRTAPIQGGRFPDLRESAARAAYQRGFDIYPIGAMVPLLRQYRFDVIAELVAAAKRGLGADAPVHLFGAGHPMMFSLGVALGCDLFDSAAYALYAREDRYLTPTGTRRLEHLQYLPCSCPVCSASTPDALRAESAETRERMLAEHNLYVTFAEMRRVKQAITQGELLELVETRARAHPWLLDGYRVLLEQRDLLESAEPATAARPFFYLSSESATRPEVRRHHERLERLAVPDLLVLIDPAIDEELPGEHPWTDSTTIPIHADEDGTTRWYVIPPFGPVPPALLETYPLTAELPRCRDLAAYTAAAAGIQALVSAHDTNVTLLHDGWPAETLRRLPQTVDIRHGRREQDSSGPTADSEP